MPMGADMWSVQEYETLLVKLSCVVISENQSMVRVRKLVVKIGLVF